MDSIEQLTQDLRKFRDDRNWKQFHDPKNLALALSIEASELNEIFLWKKESELANIPRERVQEELADVISYALLLADHYQMDIREIVQSKIQKNAIKYPIELSKDNSKKYTEL